MRTRRCRYGLRRTVRKYDILVEVQTLEEAVEKNVNYIKKCYPAIVVVKDEQNKVSIDNPYASAEQHIPDNTQDEQSVGIQQQKKHTKENEDVNQTSTPSKKYNIKRKNTETNRSLKDDKSQSIALRKSMRRQTTVKSKEDSSASQTTDCDKVQKLTRKCMFL